MKRSTLLAATALAAMGAGAAQAEDLTLCWAAWDPANALVELSKQFEEQSGHSMNFEFVPWPNFADRMLNELNSGGQLCDLLIGDSQWIGGGAEAGHYVKLNDFFDDREHRDVRLRGRDRLCLFDLAQGVRELLRAARDGGCERLVLPQGLVRRDPDIMAAFEEEHGRPLAEPATQKEMLLEIAQFFQEREIDGKTRYGAAIFTERGSEGITMGVTGALYPWGFKYENDAGQLRHGGRGELARGCRGAGVLQGTLRDRDAAGLHQQLHGRGARRVQIGPGRHGDELVRVLPRPLRRPTTCDKIDFFVNPPQNQAGSTLGGQGISVVSYFGQAGRGARVHQVVRPRTCSS